MTSVHLRACAILCFSACVTATMTSAQKLPAPSSQITVPANDVSMEAYQQHLASLQSLLETCSQARDAKSCDSAFIGADDPGSQHLSGLDVEAVGGSRPPAHHR